MPYLLRDSTIESPYSSSPLHINRQERRFQSSLSDEPISRKMAVTPTRSEVATDQVSNSNSFGSNVTLVGNRIDVAADAVDANAQGCGFDAVAYKMCNGVKSDR